MNKQELGRSITIPADAKIESGIKRVEFAEKTYELNVGIGKNDTATLYIGESALKALRDITNPIMF